jgi:hypothetical protein
VNEGAELILTTMRHDDLLIDAIQWFKDRDIPLIGTQLCPGQESWTSSTKCYCHILIDDSALGAPLKKGFGSDRPFVDWKFVEEILWREKKISG